MHDEKSIHNIYRIWQMKRCNYCNIHYSGRNFFFFEIVVAETSIHKTRVVHGTHFSIVEQTEEPVGFGYGRMEDVPRSQIIAL